jgi:hypothetical protein
MTRAAALIGATLLIFDAAAFAQSVNQTDGLDACFRQSRVADKICEQQTDAGLRWECFKKTRDAELECLTHIPPGQPIASNPPPQNVPPSPSAAASSTSSDNPPENTGSIEQPQRRDLDSTNSSSNANAAAPGAPQITATGGEATLHAQPDAQTPKKASAPPANRWIVSETTSPIDYSPLVSAVLEPIQHGDNGPINLAIHCRKKRIELMLQFSGNSAWRNQPQIYFQNGNQSPVQLDLSWSADGKMATVKNDPVSLLQPVPDGSTLKIWASGRAPQDTTFQLVGLDGIKSKVGAACNWAPQQAQTSAKRRTNRTTAGDSSSPAPAAPLRGPPLMERSKPP